MTAELRVCERQHFGKDIRFLAKIDLTHFYHLSIIVHMPDVHLSLTRPLEDLYMNINTSKIAAKTSRPPMTNNSEAEAAEESGGISVGDVFRRTVGTTSAVIQAPFATIGAVVTPRAKSSETAYKSSVVGAFLTNGTGFAGLGAATSWLMGGDASGMLFSAAGGAIAGFLGTLVYYQSDAGMKGSKFEAISAAKLRAYDSAQGSSGFKFGNSLAAGLKQDFGRAYNSGVGLVDGVIGFTSGLTDAASGFTSGLSQ